MPRLVRSPVALAILVAALVGTTAFGWRAWQGPAVDTVTAVPTRLRQTVVVSGRVLAPAKVGIGATITGRVAAVRVDDGDPVQANQVLIELERAELAAALAQATATEHAASTRIAQWHDVAAPQVREQLAQAEVNYRNAERDAQRQEQLFGQGFIGEARVDEARRSLAIARSQLAAARASAEANTPAGADRRLLEDQLAQARAARETAAAKLDQTLLRAPGAGLVLDRSAEPGDIVQPGRQLMTIALAGPTRLTALVDEKNLGLLAVGQSALVSADAYPADRFRAVLAYLAPGIDVQRGTVEVKFDVPAAPPYLRADMTVSIEIEVADRPGVLVAPAAAIRDPQSGEPWVLVVDDGRARRVPVRLGARTASEVEVAQGLSAGARLIVAPGVAAGDRVRAAR